MQCGRGLAALSSPWRVGPTITRLGGFVKRFKKFEPHIQLNLGVGPWRNLSHLECFGFIEPILGSGDHILQLQTVGQICRDVVDFLQRRLQRFHAVIGPEIAKRSMNSKSFSDNDNNQIRAPYFGIGTKNIESLNH